MDYMVHFHANIAGPAAVASQLSISVGGEIIPYSTMIISETTANYAQSVSIAVPVHNCCCDFDRVTVVNSGAQALTVVANPLLVVYKMEGV